MTIIKLKNKYNYFDRVETRFGDNDIFGHVNNVIYYSIFDTVINRFLILKCGYNPLVSEVIGISPETRCIFRSSFKYPEKIIAGLSTKKIGETSVVYDISLFREDNDKALAEGHFVHVFVSRTDMSSKKLIPERIKKELYKL